MVRQGPRMPRPGPRLDPRRWDPRNVRVCYDRSLDMLYVHALPLERAGGHYAGPRDEVLLLVSEDGQEIVGFQIENVRALCFGCHAATRGAQDA